MSWFSKFVVHPFVGALAGLGTHPAIASNPAAAQAVADAQKGATEIASVATSVASNIVADAAAAADPAMAALGQGLTDTMDAFLLKSLGPVGVAVIPGANTLLALGEAKAHDLITALFAHAKAQLPAPAVAAAGGS